MLRACAGVERTADTRPRAAWRAWQESRPPERRASCGWSGAGDLGWGIKTTAMGGQGGTGSGLGYSVMRGIAERKTYPTLRARARVLGWRAYS